jgi:rhodanese-related sulfurtransferase
MREVLLAFPGAQRALFRKYHIGGCSSCGFQAEETLEELCRRNNNLDPEEVLTHIRQSHEEDARMWVEPTVLKLWLQESADTCLVDIRSREEFNAASITGALFLSQNVMQEMMGRWPRDRRIVIVDHMGKGALDAAAYFLGHGFTAVHGLRGGIDAWAREVDSQVPRYELGA